MLQDWSQQRPGAIIIPYGQINISVSILQMSNGVSMKPPNASLNGFLTGQ